VALIVSCESPNDVLASVAGDAWLFDVIIDLDATVACVEIDQPIDLVHVPEDDATAPDILHR
jgi:hypothetical protein